MTIYANKLRDLIDLDCNKMDLSWIDNPESTDVESLCILEFMMNKL